MVRGVMVRAGAADVHSEAFAEVERRVPEYRPFVYFLKVLLKCMMGCGGGRCWAYGDNVGVVGVEKST
jgi:hypothetical protein